MVRGHLMDSHVEFVSIGDLMKDMKHFSIMGFASDGCVKYMIEYETICEKM